jgi:hypothetical protein
MYERASGDRAHLVHATVGEISRRCSGTAAEMTGPGSGMLVPQPQRMVLDKPLAMVVPPLDHLTKNPISNSGPFSATVKCVKPDSTNASRSPTVPADIETAFDTGGIPAHPCAPFIKDGGFMPDRLGVAKQMPHIGVPRDNPQHHLLAGPSGKDRYVPMNRPGIEDAHPLKSLRASFRDRAGDVRQAHSRNHTQ